MVRGRLIAGLRPWRACGLLLEAFRRHAGRRGAAAVGLVAAGAVLEGTGLLLLVPILTVIMAPQGTAHGWLQEMFEAMDLASPSGRLMLLLGAFAAVMLLRAAILFHRDMLLGELQTGFLEAQRNRVMQALAAAPWGHVARLRHARVMNLMSAEMQRVGASVQFLVQAGVAAAMLAIQVGIAFFLAPGLAAAAAAVLAVGGGLLIFGQSRAHGMGREAVQSSQTLINSAERFLGGLKIAAAQEAQAFFLSEFAQEQAQLRANQMLFAAHRARTRLVLGTAVALLGGAVVLAGFALFSVQPALLITLVLVFSRMSGPALMIQQAVQSVFYGIASFEAIQALLADLDAPIPVTADPVTPPSGPVEFRGVRFLHPGGGGLRRADLIVAPGTFLGVSGASGAGKTTLVDLMVGLLVPQSGEIRIGGVPLDAASAPGWRRGIAYVAQDGFLFHDTVRRNLVWDATGIDEATIARVLALVGAQPLVARLPDGLETVIGERGALLSGGERQRLGLARALLRRPALLVLDEATSAIDAQGEAAVLGAIAALERRPTIVMITHRQDTLRFCDRVIHVAEGGVSELYSTKHSEMER